MAAAYSRRGQLSTNFGILAVLTGIVRILLCDDLDEQLDHHVALLTRIDGRPVKRRLIGRSHGDRSSALHALLDPTTARLEDDD